MRSDLEKKITPVILCGGSGTRLWPLSRKSYPKQFSSLIGSRSLFQETLLRMVGTNFNDPIIVTNEAFRFIVAEQAQQVKIEPSSILIEPEARNTAPAILAAAFQVAEQDAEAVILVAPSDHVISNTPAFKTAIQIGAQQVAEGDIVTFGIKPKYSETAYGYLEIAEPADVNPVRLKRFIEKPEKDIASQMVKSGNFLWNSGMFLFSAGEIINTFEKHAQELKQPVFKAFHSGKRDLGFHRLDPIFWNQAEDISIDYAVMEKADNLCVVPLDSGWSDLGSWNSVWRESQLDDAGVAISGEVTAIDCSNSLIRSDSENLEVVGIGLQNLAVVAMNDAVLVADISRVQEVKKAVAELKKKEASQALNFPKEHRPWGWFERLVIGNRFQVKRIHVNPGAELSLQSHHHRAEHWVVVSGTAEVTIDTEKKLIGENESVYVPLGSVHRMKNPGKLPMVLIEVQTGAYLGEDDIVRYEDIYARSETHSVDG